DARVADVAGEEGPGFPGHLLRDPEGRAVDRLEILLPADDPELRPVGIVREGLDHIRAGVDEVTVELLNQAGSLEDHLRHERAGLKIPTALPASRRSRNPGAALCADFLLGVAMVGSSGACGQSAPNVYHSRRGGARARRDGPDGCWVAPRRGRAVQG